MREEFPEVPQPDAPGAVCQSRPVCKVDTTNGADRPAPTADSTPRETVVHAERSVSVRLLWPFIRVTQADPAAIPLLTREGISLRSFANSDTRIRFDAVVELLELAVDKMGDRRLGLRAGESFEPGDLDVLEYAARSCATLRDAIHCSCRYFHLLNSAADMMLIEDDERAIWRFKHAEGTRSTPALNDFVLTFARMFATRYTNRHDPVLEVHFSHTEPSDLAEYQRIFGGKVRMGMPDNALVIPRSYLDDPMLFANPGMLAAFSSHAEELLRKLAPDPGVSGRVRQLLLARVRGGDTSMASVARSLAMSVATLRRRLQEEGTSHSQLLDDVRHDLARMYLSEPTLAISEVAFLLGFAHVTAFYKAFRRWEGGATPAEFRSQRMAARGAAR